MQIRVNKEKTDSIDIFSTTELYAWIILLTLLYSCSAVATNSNAIRCRINVASWIQAGGQDDLYWYKPVGGRGFYPRFHDIHKHAFSDASHLTHIL